MKYVKYATIIPLVAISLYAYPSYSKVKTATYTGLISTGYDFFGIFGVPDTNISGMKYIADFTYDRSRGSPQTTEWGSGFSTGCPPYTGPIFSGKITINDISFTTDFNDCSTAFSAPWTEDIVLLHSASKIVDNPIYFEAISLNMYVRYNVVTEPLLSSLDNNINPMIFVSGNGGFSYYRFYYDTGETTYYAQASFQRGGYYSVRDAVPEPASWAMLIAGFGLVGSALRRRRNVGFAN